MSSMARLILLFSLIIADVSSQYQYVYPMAQRQVPMPQRRLVYYPVRNNCQTRCIPQTQYRWTYRPLVPVIGPLRPVQPLRPPYVAPTTPSNPSTVPPVIIPINPPPTPPPTIPPTIPSTIPPTTSTLPPSPAIPSSQITSPAIQPPSPFLPVTLPTPGPETTVPTIPLTTTTDQPPTPPPEPSIDTLLQQLRPSKKNGITPIEKGEAYKQNPCANGKALVNDFGSAITCNYLVEPNGGCPESHFCHAGASFSTTVCCPRTDRSPRCEQTKDAGNGRETAARWYYDTHVRECRRFLYKGLKGNENNFITKTQCMDACATADKRNGPDASWNPCRFGDVARDSSKKKIECGPDASDSCPNGYYCHVGSSPETNACCEGSGLSDTCLLSLNMGVGTAQLRRYYYNTLTKRCGEFVYKGLKGNENNFLSLAECDNACKKWNDPCPISIGRLSVRTQCSLEGGECAASEWCHIGHSAVTTVCCPGAADPCDLAPSTGEGGHNLTRWYSDVTDKSCSRRCKPFQYGGTKGNQNNFVTKQMCEERCKRACPSPCGSGVMLLLANNEPRLCSPLSPCPNTHWCHVGATPQTTVCCSAVRNTCELPLEEGHGSSHLTRWRFDSLKRKCVSFLYKGEGGNQNMFLTSEDCGLVCPTYKNPCSHGRPIMIGSEPKICTSNERCPSTHFCHFGADENDYCCPKNGNPCEMDLSVGVGEYGLKRFYYDKSSRRCREFMYLGIKGNANNFRNIEECELVCPVMANPCRDGDPLLDEDREPVICGGESSCPSGYFCHVGAAPETTNCCPGTRRACDLPMEQGAGEAKLERYFFDGSVQMCRFFFYRGLKGNSNNFISKAECREACKEINPCAEGEPFADPSGDRMLCTGGQRHDSCPAKHYCHVGASALTTVCCPKTYSDPCDAPLAEGHGKEDLPRYYYDRKQNKCTAFTYGGSGGNENNFISLTTCQAVCPAHRAYCPHGNPLTEKGGQVATCGVHHSCPEGFICHMNSEFNLSICCQDPVDFCQSPRDPGPCMNFETRWGYDAKSDSCVEYQYGGCEGTLNNFPSLHRCTEICCKEYRK